MALSVVTEESRTEGTTRAVVVVEGDSIAEVQSADARTLAIRHAGTLGVARAGVSTGSGPYPVMIDGAPTGKYRYDYPLQGAL